MYVILSKDKTDASYFPPHQNTCFSIRTKQIISYIIEKGLKVNKQLFIYF